MGAVFKREFKAYFQSPIGYVFLALMFGFSGYAFVNMLGNQVSYVQYIFSFIINLIMIVIPLLTMRLLSEDKKTKTDQLLFTTPVSLSGIVLGKYFAALLMFLIGMAPTVCYIIITAVYAVPDWNVFAGNFLGVALLGAALIAVGLFISSLTESQIVAAIGTFAVIAFILIMDGIPSALPENLGFLGKIVSGLSFMTRVEELSSGLLNAAHILFFVSAAVIFNFLAVRMLEKKRWS